MPHARRRSSPRSSRSPPACLSRSRNRSREAVDPQLTARRSGRKCQTYPRACDMMSSETFATQNHGCCFISPLSWDREDPRQVRRKSPENKPHGCPFSDPQRKVTNFWRVKYGNPPTKTQSQLNIMKGNGHPTTTVLHQLKTKNPLKNLSLSFRWVQLNPTH